MMPESQIPEEGQQIVLILVGLVGSGKHPFPLKFRRCNQDELGNRQRVEALARSALRQGLSVCIDRTNVDESQRAHWVEIAHKFPRTVVWVIAFDTPYEICAARLRERTLHPTIKDPQTGLLVLSRFSSDFVAPSSDEGFHRLLSIRPCDHQSPVYSASDVYAILKRLRDSPVLQPSNHLRNSDFPLGHYVRVNPRRGRGSRVRASAILPRSRDERRKGNFSASGVELNLSGYGTEKDPFTLND